MRRTVSRDSTGQTVKAIDCKGQKLPFNAGSALRIKKLCRRKLAFQIPGGDNLRSVSRALIREKHKSARSGIAEPVPSASRAHSGTRLPGHSLLSVDSFSENGERLLLELLTNVWVNAHCLSVLQA